VQARSAQTAAETYATDHGGAYTGISVGELQKIAPALKDEATSELIRAEATKEAGYVVETKSVGSGDEFQLERTPSGGTVRTCKPEKQGGCLSGGIW
jgi:hypothetical protein